MLLGQVILYCCRFHESLITTAFFPFCLICRVFTLPDHLNEHFQRLIQYRLNFIFILIIHTYVRLTPIASLPVFLRIEVPPTHKLSDACCYSNLQPAINTELSSVPRLSDRRTCLFPRYCIKMYEVTAYLLHILCVLVVVGSVSVFVNLPCLPS